MRSILIFTTIVKYVEASRALLASSTESLLLTSSTERQEYEHFRARHGRAEEAGEVSYESRLELYLARKAAVQEHNSRKDISWRAGLNQFADYTQVEFDILLGHRSSRWWRGRPSASSSFMEASTDGGAVADSMDWRARLNRTNQIKNQGACGSCWAVAAVGALETHAEIAKVSSDDLSYEQIVDCTPNPHECGGTGGCSGATAELAFEYASKTSIVLASSYQGYQSKGSKSACHDVAKTGAVSVGGYTRLPENKLQPLLQAVANKGPVVVSVDASGWSMYAEGVYDTCKPDATVNHAVLLVGYGKSDQGFTTKTPLKYWLIRNSWGDSWGENGYIKLQRHDSDNGKDGHCGTDHNPQAGVGCKGGPSEMPVCGMCGVLSDSSYPTGVRLEV
mmetsp:Transcript_35802/g.82167  ORF Transcript_35802/g.82167 Transcript_35802/m.82167 type:complete len:392 (+) Transcript_35802:88-1263(+)